MAASPVSPRRLATPAGVSALTAVWLLAVLGLPEGAAIALSNLGTMTAAYAGAIGCAMAAHREHGRPRLVWTLLAAAAASWGTGQAIWSVHELVLGREVPFPSLADVGFLLAVPLAAAALWRILDGDAAMRWRIVLDGMLVGGSLLALSWFAFLEAVIAEEAGQGLVTAIALAYPLGNVVLLAVLTSVVLGARRGATARRLPLPLIGAGLGALAVADAGFAYLTQTGAYATGHPIDAGWALGFLLLCAAGVRGAPRATPGRVGPSGSRAALLPYTAVVLASLAGAIDYAANGELDPFVVWTFAGVVALLIVRQVLVLRENETLTAALRARMEELRHGEERFRALVQHSSDVVVLIDGRGTVRWLSDSVERVLGCRHDEVAGAPLADILDPESAAVLRRAVGELAREPMGMRSLELGAVGGDGRLRPIEVTITNLLRVPSVAGLVCNIRDVTEERALAEQLAHQAFHDSLTALANRALFTDRVDHALRRQSGGLAVLFLDLDGFKFINDWLGHIAGDQLLTQVATRLRDCVRPGDTIARLGGDEFAILVEDARSAEDAVLVAERIRRALVPPFLVADRLVEVTGSVGIATAAAGHAAVEELLRNADLAMYRAKEAGGGGHEVFDDAMHDALVDQLQLAADMALAVESEQLVLHFQPTFDLAAGRLNGVEALVRWQHPARGLLGPGAFISEAERSGAIVAIGDWVLDTACRQAVAWTQHLPDDAEFTMSVNVSGVQVTPALPGKVAAVLARTGLPPRRLVLEMTESTLIRAADSAEVLRQLKEVGVGLAIDDFGTGYSSLSYLHQYPIDRLKIDRSFVSRMHEADGAVDMIAAILHLAGSLSLDTVAEGVESQDDLEVLRDLGCRLAQGFHLARPAPAPDIELLLGLTPRAG